MRRNATEETHCHVSLECFFALLAWKILGLDIDRLGRRVRSWLEVFEYLRELGEGWSKKFFMVG